MTSDASNKSGLIKSSHYLYQVYPKNSGQINSNSWKKKATDSSKTFKFTVKFLKITLSIKTCEKERVDERGIYLGLSKKVFPLAPRQLQGYPCF